MSSCPKCNKKLHLYNISQLCPNCGVNLCFANFEKNFVKEAKEAELSLANMHVKVRRLKVSFIGSKLAILRLIAILFPIAGLLIPAGNVVLKLPFFQSEFAISGFGIYTAFTDGSIPYILSMNSSQVFGEAFKGLTAALLVYASLALFAVFVFILTALCFCSYKNMQKVIAVVSALGAVDSVFAAFFIGNFVKTSASYAMIDVTSGIGAFIEIAMFLVPFVINLLLCIKGIPVEYDEGMEERARIYKEVKKGRIKIEDLPMPIVETAETRAIDEQIAKAEEEHLKKEQQEAENAEKEDAQSEETSAQK